MTSPVEQYCKHPGCEAWTDSEFCEDHRSTRRKPGVWVTYDHDHGPYVIALYTNAEDAAQAAARQGYGRVAHWPYGMEFTAAIKQWEE